MLTMTNSRRASRLIIEGLKLNKENLFLSKCILIKIFRYNKVTFKCEEIQHVYIALLQLQIYPWLQYKFCEYIMGDPEYNVTLNVYFLFSDENKFNLDYHHIANQKIQYKAIEATWNEIAQEKIE